MTAYTLPQSRLDSHPNFKILSFDGRHGLPNSVREALLHLKKGEAALVIDGLLYCGFTAGKLYTFKKVMAKLAKAGFTLSKALVRRALNSGVFQSSTLQTHRA